MKHLIVGYGEVGRALHKVLGKKDVYYIDQTHGTWFGEKLGKKLDVIHICIPYVTEYSFKSVVRDYAKKAKLTIVHSSVPVGTCDALGVVHSPIRGVHPHLAKGIRTFVKYFGGKDAKKAAAIFCDLNIRTRCFLEARTTEAIKLWCTTAYGRMIMLEKEIYAWCEENEIDFHAVYTEATRTYNEGYKKLGMGHVSRPVLKHMDGPIGGHCVLPNAKLLGVKL